MRTGNPLDCSIARADLHDFHSLVWIEKKGDHSIEGQRLICICLSCLCDGPWSNALCLVLDYVFALSPFHFFLFFCPFFHSFMPFLRSTFLCPTFDEGRDSEREIVHYTHFSPSIHPCKKGGEDDVSYIHPFAWIDETVGVLSTLYVLYTNTTTINTNTILLGNNPLCLSPHSPPRTHIDRSTGAYLIFFLFA